MSESINKEISVKALTILLSVDVLEKYKIIEDECNNLENALFSFIKDLTNEKEISGEKRKVPNNWYKFKNREKDYFYNLRGVRNTKEIANKTRKEFENIFLKIIKNTNNNSALFDLICLRDHLLTKIAEKLTEQIKNYQIKLFQTREMSPTVSPSTDILRRFNFSTYFNFLSDFARMKRHHVKDFINGRYKNKVPDSLKESIRKTLEDNDTIQVWMHDITSRFSHFKIDFQENSEICKSRIFTSVKIAYWFFELPVYIPILLHELIHPLIDDVDTSSDKLDNALSMTKEALYRAIYHFIKSMNYLSDIESDDKALVFTKELLTDVLATYIEGPAYLMALFLQIVGIGGHTLFEDIDDYNKCDMNKQNYIVPKELGVPWIVRIKLVNFLCQRIYKNSNDKMAKYLQDGINDFIEQFVVSGKKKYYGFSPLFHQYCFIREYEEKLYELCRDTIEDNLIPIFNKIHTTNRTQLAPHIKDILKEVYEKYMCGCYLNNCKCDDRITKHKKCVSKMKKLKKRIGYNRLEDVAWESILTLSHFAAECPHFDTEFRHQFPNFPSGRRTFMLALETYNYRESLHTAFLQFPPSFDNNEGLIDDIRKRRYFEEETNFENVQNKLLKEINKLQLDPDDENLIYEVMGYKENKFIAEEIEKKLLDKILTTGGINLCIFSLCRRDIRKGKITIDKLNEYFDSSDFSVDEFKKQDKDISKLCQAIILRPSSNGHAKGVEVRLRA